MKQVHKHTQTIIAATMMIKKSAVSLVSTGVSGVFVTFNVSISFS